MSGNFTLLSLVINTFFAYARLALATAGLSEEAVKQQLDQARGAHTQWSMKPAHT
jgi:hypothetical protein